MCTRYTIKTTHWKDPRGIGARPDDAHLITDPDTHGVVEFVENGKAISVKEKPLEPRSIFCLSVI